MNTKRRYSLIVAMLFASAVGFAGQPSKSFLSVQDVLLAWQSNYGALKSMKVCYSEKIIIATPSPADPNIVKTLVKWNHVDRIEEGSKFRVRYSAAKEGFAKTDSAEEMSFDGIYQKVYLPARKLGTIYAGLTKKGIGTTNLLKYYLLSHPQRSTSSPVAGPTFSKTINMGLSDPNFTISVRSVLEQVAGQACHVLELVTNDEKKQKVAIIWVAHEKGMLPMKYQQLNSRGAITHETVVKEINFAKTKTGSLWFPKKAFRMINLPAYLGTVKYEFNVLEFTPHIKLDEKTLRLDFPNGTRVFDAELGVNYIVGVE